MSQLQEILDRLKALPADQQQEIDELIAEATGHLPWVPNPGPQRRAFDCEADELFYGGQAGPGKTDLLIGLSLTAHKRSLILRRTHGEATKLVDRYSDILGSRVGWNSQDKVWRYDGRTIDIGGCQLEDDKQKYKGNPHDLVGFDEISDFTESQYVFITQWLRSTEAGQRCRVVCAGNPPTRAEGLWIIEYWAPWLDPKHPNPAKDGELRWYVGGHEVEGPGDYLIDGRPTKARSRTVIRGELADNPELAETGYDSVLAAMPEELRNAYRLGLFDKSIKDDPFQVIPTEWVRAAMRRWTPKPPPGIPMVAIGVDPAQGGPDRTVLAPRYDWWFAPFVCVPGKVTPLGKDVAGLIVTNRLHNAKIVLDMGGGYGGSTYEQLIENVDQDDVVRYVGAAESTARTSDGSFGFVNKRSETIWKFREALDPSQPNGSPLALPDDPQLLAELTVVTFQITSRGIAVLPKDSEKGPSVKKLLGRSPDKGDAVVMSWSAGARLVPPGGKYGESGETFRAEDQPRPTKETVMAELKEGFPGRGSKKVKEPKQKTVRGMRSAKDDTSVNKLFNLFRRKVHGLSGSTRDLTDEEVAGIGQNSGVDIATDTDEKELRRGRKRRTRGTNTILSDDGTDGRVGL